MAGRRLNRKVAFIGLILFVIVILAAIAAVMMLSRNPEPYIKDARAAVEKAKLTEDADEKIELYDEAVADFSRARSYAKTDQLRIELLFEQMFIHEDQGQWKKILGCWKGIESLEADNVEALYGQLKYYYITADSGTNQLWKEVLAQTEKFLKIAQEKAMMDVDLKGILTVGEMDDGLSCKKLGNYLYLLKAKAKLQAIKSGQAIDVDMAIEEVFTDLNMATEADSENVDVYSLMSLANMEKSRILIARGDVEGETIAIKEATDVLQKAIELAPNKPLSYINLLTMKMMAANKLEGEKQTEKIKSIENEFVALTEKFDTDPKIFSAISKWYQISKTENLEKAIAAAEKALELDGENVAYAMSLCQLYNRYANFYSDAAFFNKALVLAETVQNWPDMQDGAGGPRMYLNQRNKHYLYRILASYYADQIVDPIEMLDDQQQQKVIDKLDKIVYAIEQMVGSGENPEIIKWKGIVAFIKGDKKAVKQMYAAYERIKAGGGRDSMLTYVLAKAFENSAEVGARGEFLSEALRAGIAYNKPYVILEYCELLLKLKIWPTIISNVRDYENKFGSTDRTKAILAKAFVGANQFDHAESLIAEMDADNADVILLKIKLLTGKISHVSRAAAKRRLDETDGETEIAKDTNDNFFELDELKSYVQQKADLTEKLIATNADLVTNDLFVAVCRGYMSEKKYEKARSMAEYFNRIYPENVSAKVLSTLMVEPDPGQVTTEKIREIELAVRQKEITNPAAKNASIASYYRDSGQTDEAIAYFKKAIGIEDGGQVSTYDAESESYKWQVMSVGYLFDLIANTKDIAVAEVLATIAKNEDLDACGGQFYAARVSIMKKDYEQALRNLDASLKERPVFSQAYMIRATVNSFLGDDQKAIEDIHKAIAIMPQSKETARILANILYRRNQRLGNSVTQSQKDETQAAIERAMTLDNRNAELAIFYAQYISEQEPQRALALMQNIQKMFPTVKNAVALGQMAQKNAQNQTDPDQQKVLLEIALAAFENATKIDPASQQALNSLAEYYRQTNQPKKAEELLGQSNDEMLLWRHYIKNGQMDEAKEILTRLLADSPEDIVLLKGSLYVAHSENDAKAVEEISNRLIEVDDNVLNRLAQIEAMLKVGLAEQAESKLKSLKEKYPDDQQAIVFEVMVTAQLGHAEKALELANIAITNGHIDAKLWSIRGQLNAAMANYQQALEDFKQSLLLQNDPIVRLSLAKIYARLGNEDQATIELEGLVRDPQSPVQVGLLLETIYGASKRLSELSKFYDTVMELYPDNMMWVKKAAAFALAQKDYNKAGQLFVKCWNVTSNAGRPDGDALDGFFDTLIRSGNLDAFFAESKNRIDTEFGPIVLYWMAVAKLEQGDREQASEYARKALERAAKDEPMVSKLLMRTYDLLGPEEVTKYGEDRLAENPDSMQANYSLCDIALIQERYNEAVKYVDKCIEIAADSPNKIEYELKKAAIYSAAYNKTHNNDYIKKSIEQYESLLKKLPNNTGLLNNLAYLKADAGLDLQEAQQYAEKVCKISPNEPGYWDTYAYVLYKNGQYERALEMMNRALQLYGNRGIDVGWDVYWHQGLICEKLGNKENAAAAYQLTLQTGENKIPNEIADDIKEAIKRLE